VKLLFDENLSERLISRLAASYPGSAHVDQVGLHGKSDAGDLGSCPRARLRDRVEGQRFRQMSFLHGAPPKVIWLPVGKAGTEAIVRLLK
jgi:predicted nuclease of predicted toxin-antitoxin system